MRILAGTVARPSVHAEEIGKKKVESLTICVTEHNESDAIWHYTVDAVLGRPQVNVRRLGTLASVPPTVTGYPTRVLGVASLPGVVQWIVTVSRYSGTDPEIDQEGNLPVSWPTHYVDLELAVSDELTSPGLTPNEPHAEVFGERWDYYAAALPAGNTNVNVQANERVQIISAYQIGTGGAFQIVGVGGFLALPPDGSAVMQPLGRIRGPLTVAFAGMPAGGGAYLIEYTT